PPAVVGEPLRRRQQALFGAERSQPITKCTNAVARGRDDEVVAREAALQLRGHLDLVGDADAGQVLPVLPAGAHVRGLRWLASPRPAASSSRGSQWWEADRQASGQPRARDRTPAAGRSLPRSRGADARLDAPDDPLDVRAMADEDERACDDDEGERRPVERE